MLKSNQVPRESFEKGIVENKINTVFLSEFLQSSLEASQEHFELVKITLPDSEQMRRERVMSHASILLSWVRHLNLPPGEV